MKENQRELGTLGHLIKRKRRLLGLSQGAFAKKYGFSQRAISYWENNEQFPRNESKRATLASILGMDMAEVVAHLQNKQLKKFEERYAVSLESQVFLTQSTLDIIISLVKQGCEDITSEDLSVVQSYEGTLRLTDSLIMEIVSQSRLKRQNEKELDLG